MVMAAAASAALIAELDGAVRDGSPERRVQILRQVTDLFLSDADRLNETQISVFDDVLVRLIERVEARTLAHLSVTLSEIDTAPREATRQLAFHDDASVAVPVLTKSNPLSEKDLIEIANTRGPATFVGNLWQRDHFGSVPSERTFLACRSPSPSALSWRSNGRTCCDRIRGKINAGR
jgi:hypothetical protein